MSHSNLPSPPASELPHVIIVGGGFAGLSLAKRLKNAPVRITLLDRQNHHLFQPLLYQVATAGIGAPEISEPIRDILRKHNNVTVLLGEVTDINPDKKTITLEQDEIEWDYLYIASGASHSYFGKDHWGKHAPGLKTLDDAMEIRRRMILAYERAERADSDEERRKDLNFVVVGAGPTGVELAGALVEIAQHTMARNFRNFDPSQAKVMLVEAGPRVLSAYDDELSESAKKQLESLGVQVLLNTAVTDIQEDGVYMGEDFIPTSTVLWAAGVKSSGLGAFLGVPLDRAGRVIVSPDLSVPGYPEISVLGDAASAQGKQGKPVPGLAPAATQMGDYAGRRLIAHLQGRLTEPFEYVDKGQMSTIGRRRAVAQIGKMKISGVVAWLGWAFIHVAFLIGFRNRVSVMIDWIWAYFTRRRGARILFGVDASEAAPLRVREQALKQASLPPAEALPFESTLPTGTGRFATLADESSPKE